MVYDFAAKIKNIKNDKYFDANLLEEKIAELHKGFEKPLEITILQSDPNIEKSILVRSEVSISSLPMFHDSELFQTINTFKDYMDKIADMVYGEISESEAFYNNTRTFSKLY